MRKYVVMKRMYIEDQEAGCWEEADTDTYTAVNPVDAVMKFMVYGENFRGAKIFNSIGVAIYARFTTRTTAGRLN